MRGARIAVVCVLASLPLTAAACRWVTEEEAHAGFVAREGAVDEIETLLADQVEAWNRGDVEAFMTGYWNSPDLRFASGDSVQQGWRQTLERYRQRYPDREAMGALSFEEIHIQMLSRDWALAFGRWRLERDNDRPGGLFTLLLQYREDLLDTPGWRIVHDHTSSGE
jgi:hypothetical protein